MKVLLDDGSTVIEGSCCVALGNFDGVHIGHQVLLDRMLAISAKFGVKSVACTFDPHPVSYYGGKKKLICTPNQKLKIFEALGVQSTFIVDFKRIVEYTPRKFFEEYIVERFKAKAVIVGYDFTFGLGRSGNTDTLKELCSEYEIECDIVGCVAVGGLAISSSRIRGLLLHGCMPEAARLLGRYFSCEGIVVLGNQVGRTIGYPTVNLAVENEIVPPDGIYSGYTNIQGIYYAVMIYIGTRPTFTDKSIRKFEANIIGYEGHLYNQHMEIFICRFLRQSARYDTTAELIKQIDMDKVNTIKDMSERVKALNKGIKDVYKL